MTLTPKGQLYVVGVTAVGLVVIGHCVAHILGEPVSSQWLILAGLTLFSGSFTIKVPSLQARLSVSETFVFASVLLFGTCAGTLTVVLDTIVAAWSARKRSREPLRIIFNTTSSAISIWAAGTAFYLIAGVSPLSEQSPAESVPLPQLIFPLAALTLIYFTVNTVLVAIAVAAERKERAYVIWRKNFLWLSLNYFGGASVAALLVSYTRSLDFTALGVIVPLLVISYFTYKTSLDRLQDAIRHVDEVNRLYISTIETLATAIDAKDQVTHGHIRRVQQWALALAAELGVHDPGQMKAIEAAALLHDMGKLVVPEHILNKPGRLTPGEFDKMKRHASVGADILSSVRFPYPVVPIVRYHHENWDGTGYPSGLRGVAIPIGARILAVVDCFDALTSDRPYRKALSDEEAVAILVQRRGTMYDPMVVDMFLQVKDRLAVTIAKMSETPMETLVSASRLPPDVASFPTQSRIARAALDDSRVREMVNTVLASVIQATGAGMSILFVKDPDTDALVSIGAHSKNGRIDRVIAMSLGSGISGWVAANGKAIQNGDANLDLPAELLKVRGSRCLAVPVHIKGDTVGVITAYADDPRGFSERDVTLLEGMARSIEASPVAKLVEAALSREHLKPSKQPGESDKGTVH
jgi:putative nucleotidyltransferase with HDIG domain